MPDVKLLNHKELAELGNEDLLAHFEALIRQGAGISYVGLTWTRDEIRRRMKRWWEQR